MKKNRSGKYISQPEGYKAFIPEPLPPKPDIKFDKELQRLLSEADRALGRLDGVIAIIPNPDLFIKMYIFQEAVLSSQIEGTQSSLEDVINFEAGGKPKTGIDDVKEVFYFL